MKCQKCGGEVNLSIEEASHDENFLDIKAECDDEDCGWSAYTFVPTDSLVPAERIKEDE